MIQKFTPTSIKWKVWFLPLMLLMSITLSFAGNHLARPLKGKVVDENNQGIPFATVQIKGTENGTTTDMDGNFNIEVEEDQSLIVSYLGYDDQEIAVAGQSEIEIKMVPSTSQLEQVVVVAYGSQKKRAVTGAISTVKGEQLTKQPLLTAVQGIQGLAPGIRVVGSSQPGAQPRVTIRGLGTILTDENPLYVVDGVLTNNITNINTADILSVDVLKDGSAAMYGSRSSNGVILITTNKGKSGKPKISLDISNGFRQLNNLVKMADRDQYLEYTNEARKYNSDTAITTFDKVSNTDWFKQISRNGIIRNINLNVNGGTDQFTYLFSAGYLKDEGVIKGADYNRITLRSNNEFNISKYLKIGNTLAIGLTNSENKSNGIFTDAYRASPAFPVKDKGNYGYQPGLSAAGNPVANLELTNDAGKGIRLQGTLYGTVTFGKGLSLTSNFGLDNENSSRREYNPVYSYGTFTQTVSELRKTDGNFRNWIWTNLLNYNKKLTDDHAVEITLGQSAESSKSAGTKFRVANVPKQENLWYLARGDQSTLTLLEDKGFLIRRSSLFGRANYSFRDKYNLSGVLRRDGSSGFPANQKFGTFYSLGASWIISDESFFNKGGLFESLKFRMGYANLGNDGISSLVNNELSALLAVTNTGPYAFGTNLTEGITFDQIKDAAATWETTKGFDAGFEFGMFNNKLIGEISYYNKLTNAYINVPTPAFVDPNGTLSQAADIRNSGVETNLAFRKVENDNFSWRLGVNGTFNTNNVENIRGGIDLKEGGLGNGEVTTNTVVGQPIGSFWLYEVDGIFKTQAEIDNGAAITGSLPGDFKYKDLNNDKIIDERDRSFAGSYQPKLYYGINAGFNYREIDFSVDCYGNTGNKVYNGKKAVRFGNENIEASRLDRWTSSKNSDTEYRASNSIPKPSTYFLESGSFFRINNITLGYTIPESAAGKLGLGKTRLFVTGQNPITLKKFSGFSPELPGSNALNSGIELFVYPITATYMVGLNINFK